MSSQGSRSHSNRESLTVEGAADQQAPTNPTTPEPQPDSGSAGPSNTPSTPDLIPTFDWDDFEARYERAIAEADANELEILKEFDALSKYFNVWAAASSAHDNERAVKRLQTRQRYVTLAEDKMSQKQNHYNEVLKAFQSALALLKSN